ncbi:MAG: hypothetical protein RL632_1162 [Bacteroidota bacterium]|jgi:uncharacterized damage-inducible protein DinB
MKEFLLRKFEIEYHAIQALIRCIETQEDEVPQFCINGICHMINSHHIWNSRLNAIPPESNEWDVFPIHYLEKLNQQNHRETCDFLEKQDLNNAIDSPSNLPKSAADILFHLLQHAAYHRGQIIYALKMSGLKYPQFGLTPLED